MKHMRFINSEDMIIDNDDFFALYYNYITQQCKLRKPIPESENVVIVEYEVSEKNVGKPLVIADIVMPIFSMMMSEEFNFDLYDMISDCVSQGIYEYNIDISSLNYTPLFSSFSVDGGEYIPYESAPITRTVILEYPDENNESTTIPFSLNVTAQYYTYTFNNAGMHTLKFKLNSGVNTLTYDIYFDGPGLVLSPFTYLIENVVDVFGSGNSMVAAMFYFDCPSIKSLETPAQIKFIDGCAFTDSSITKLIFNEGLEELGGNVFQGCAFEELYLPSTLVRIPENKGVLSGCTINPDGFTNNSNFSEYELNYGQIKPINGLKISSNNILVGVIEDELPQNIIVPNGVTKLENNIFSSCPNIKTIVLPDSVETIDYYSIFKNDNLEHVTLSSNLVFFDHGVLFSNPKLTSVSYKGVEYTSKRALYDALIANGVEVDLAGANHGPNYDDYNFLWNTGLQQ